MTPQISIILAFRNPGPDFRLAIQSVFAQTFSDWELLLMDDGSTDGALEFARDLADPRVRVFSDGLSLNLNNRLNQLIDLARAPYIARMDGDDMMHPERLEKQYALLRDCDSDTVIGTGAYTIDAASRVMGLRRMCLRQQGGYSATKSFIHPTVIASAEWFRRYRYSESFIFHRSQDAELWVRSSAGSRFVTIDQPLLFYREVGTFSLEKYIGTRLGMVVLASRLARESRIGAAYGISIEVAKLWVMAVAATFGVSSRIVSQRYTKVASSDVAEAEAIIDRIKAVRLPTFSSGVPTSAGVLELSVQV